MFKLLLATSISVFGFVSASEAQMQCDMPHQGSWLLEMGQTTTFAGPGGGPGSSPFELAVKDCGETIVVTGIPPIETGAIKTLSRDGDQYNYSTVYGGYPITFDLFMTDPGHMKAFWTFAGRAASAPGTATYQPGSAGLLRDSRCGCKPFIEALRESVTSNDDFIKLYRQLINAPTNLVGLPWEADVSEALLDLQTNLEISLSDAVDILNGMSGGRHRTLNVDAEIQRRLLAKSNGSGGSGDTPFSSPANTDARTCKIEWTQHADGCAADILDSSTLEHEGVHRRACLAQNKIKNAWDMFDGSQQPPSYLSVSNQSGFLAAEEIRAYQASNSYILKTYAAMCGKPLN